MTVPKKANSRNSGVMSERSRKVGEARLAWIGKLIDVSRRNNLLYYRDLKTGTLDLSDAPAKQLNQLIRGKRVSLQALVPQDPDHPPQDRSTEAKLVDISRRALANLEEKGLQTLFLAFGLASWPAVDQGRPPEAAVVLVPVTANTGARSGGASLARAGETQVNPVLLRVLELEYGCKIDGAEIVRNETDEEDEDCFDPAVAFDRLRRVTSKIKGFEVKPRIVLGNFHFHKMAMVKDLENHEDEMVSNDLVAAVAGDLSARAELHREAKEVAARDLDDIPPENEFLVLDADSSQQRAIVQIVAGQSGVIQGPPGTGKSQTITNLIGALVAAGKRVLFVAEKRAALEVVSSRLQAVGLDYLSLDLHRGDVSKREILAQIGRSLSIARTPPDVNDQEQARFGERRTRLNKHVSAIHTSIDPSGLSVYQLEGRLLRLSSKAQITLRWRGSALERLTASSAAEVVDLLAELKGLSGLFLRTDPSPWNGANLPDGAAVTEAIDEVASTIEALYLVTSSVKEVVTPAGLPMPADLKETREVLGLLKGIRNLLESYSSGFLELDLESVVASLAPAEDESFRGFVMRLVDGPFRKAVKSVLKVRLDKRAPSRQLLKDVRTAAKLVAHWKASCSSARTPFVPQGLEQAQNSVAALGKLLKGLAGKVSFERLADQPFRDIGLQLAALSSDTKTPYRIPRLLEIEERLRELGAIRLVDYVKQNKVRAELWPAMFEHAWLSSCLDKARSDNPNLAGFDGQVHQKIVRDFCSLDVKRLKDNCSRVRRLHAERAFTALNEHRDQASLVAREVQKKNRHIPIRRLLAEATDVLLALVPCWMASPLSVSQLIAADRKYFDVVIFDEASQVLPEDSVPSLLRGSQAVVAGDKHQLPPTTFFDADTEDDEDTPEAVAGFESILDIMSQFLDPSWMLEWHYRSRDEALIAFSNRNIYRNQLVTFPGAAVERPISHVLVEQDSNIEANEDSPSPEVRRVVELVLQHAAESPGETLGVITMGIKHAQRVQLALDAALRDSPELQDFFDENRKERFFIKNLERVQGDERDAIILSIGYAKDPSGRLHYRFGPLLQEGGERRLNVAVTRARKKMTVVSSFSHLDMDPAKLKRDGMRLLRAYLEYASSGRSLTAMERLTDTPLNPFEEDVLETLKRKGLDIIPQYGVSNYRLDFAVKHPSRPGQFVMAIECDGASYHSAPTARDRDRLRQQHLEALGWRFVRIWSTDWFMDRESEVERVVRIYEQIVSESGEVPTAHRPTKVKAIAPTTGVQQDLSTADNGPRPRGDRPDILQYSSIGEYSYRELRQLIGWIKSDGILRTREEMMREMVSELGFQKLGSKMRRILENALVRSEKKV